MLTPVEASPAPGMRPPGALPGDRKPGASRTAQPTRAPVRGHLDQVDLFRVLTFAAVVAVHATAFTNPSVSTGEGVVGQLLHFTREAFFFLTGFVLVFSQGGKPLRLTTFWGRRFKAIGIPYLVWTAIYLGYSTYEAGGPVNRLPKTFVVDAVSGRGYYHLYFLLVTMQAYLLFPVLARVLEATRSHPWWLIGAAAIIELAETFYLHHATPPSAGFLHWYGEWAYALFPSYLLYVVAGALAARHLPVAQDWVLDHRTPLAWAGGSSAAAAVGWFFYSIHHGANAGDGAHDASTVLQPVEVLWSCGAILLLAIVSCRWVAGRRSGRWNAALHWCSSASFGIYLIHPLVLNELLVHGFAGPQPRVLPLPFASIVAWLITLIASGLVCEVIRRTPLALPLTGRSRSRRRRP